MKINYDKPLTFWKPTYRKNMKKSKKNLCSNVMVHDNPWEFVKAHRGNKSHPSTTCARKTKYIKISEWDAKNKNAIKILNKKKSIETFRIILKSSNETDEAVDAESWCGWCWLLSIHGPILSDRNNGTGIPHNILRSSNTSSVSGDNWSKCKRSDDVGDNIILLSSSLLNIILFIISVVGNIHKIKKITLCVSPGL